MTGPALPVIAIVGRPNVGKSTFVNACTRRRISVVDPTEGVTRDRVSVSLVHDGRAFELMDMGGIGIVDAQELDDLVEGQIERGMKSAAAIIFMVSAKDGVTAQDKRVARRLHQLGKPVVFAAN
jgi:GTPase